MVTEPLETSHPLAPQARYSPGAIAFHWATVVLVVIVGTLGLLHDTWPRSTQAYWINVHAWIGIALWLVLLGRFGYRLNHSPPTLPPTLGTFARRFSSPVHWSLYALLFVIPIVGFITFIYHGRILHLGVFDLNLGVNKNRTIFEPTEDIHGYLAYALFTLSGLHALAALWHHFIANDGVLARMWPVRGRR